MHEKGRPKHPEHVPRSPPPWHIDNMDTCPALKRTYGSEDRTCTPAGHHIHINSRSTHISLLTRAASEHARPHVPPNLALILAWTYGAVARALGSLVKSNPTASITFADSSFHHETGSSIYRPGKGQTKSRFVTMHILYNHNTTQPATVRRYYRERCHF